MVNSILIVLILTLTIINIYILRSSRIKCLKTYLKDKKMSLVNNKEIIAYIKKLEVTKNCTCKTDIAIHRCRVNCNNVEFHKINYDSKD